MSDTKAYDILSVFDDHHPLVFFVNGKKVKLYPANIDIDGCTNSCSHISYDATGDPT